MTRRGRSHMDQGLNEARKAQRRAEAAEAERFAAAYLGGIVDNERRDHDVRDAHGRPYEVKHPRTGFSYVDGGDVTHRPVYQAIIVERDWHGRLTIVGTVEPSQWRWGAPRPGFAERWFVERREIPSDDLSGVVASTRRADEEQVDPVQVDDEPSADRPSFGVDPRSVEMSAEERRRAQWRKDQRTHRARVANAPEPMPWADPDTLGRGLGPGQGGRPPRRSSDG